MNKEFMDQLGRNISVPFPPQRIISLVPSQTELLHDLGLGERVVGITKFCVHPEEWFRTKSRVGGTKKLDHEKIAQLNPDLIIANKEENLKEDIDKLSDSFPVWVSDIDDLQSAYEMIQALGDICDASEISENVVQQIQKGFDQLTLDTRGDCVYLIWNDPIMAAGSDTFISKMIEAAGFRNLVSDIRYPELSENQLNELSPDYLLLSSEPFPFKEKHIERFQQINPDAEILLVDGELFSWYGSRLKMAPEYFATLGQ